MKSYVQVVTDYLNEHGDIDLGLFCYRFQVGREAMKERLAVICTDKDALIQSLTNFSEGKTDKLH